MIVTPTKLFGRNSAKRNIGDSRLPTNDAKCLIWLLLYICRCISEHDLKDKLDLAPSSKLRL